MVFIPDTTGLDLREQERYWQYVREGREHDYHGIAIHPRHLSLWERVVVKRDEKDDPELDAESKKAEMRNLYDKMQAATGKEGAGQEGSHDVALSDKVSMYFEWGKITRRIESMDGDTLSEARHCRSER